MGVVSDVNEIAQVVYRFPETFAQAKRDWATFEAGNELGLYTAAQKRTVTDWFDRLPDLWQMIRPNWSEAYTPDAPAKLQFMYSVDNWLNTYWLNRSSLGVAPLLIAGVLIAAIFGTAGVLWGISYIQEQSNVHNLIENVSAGKIPADVLATHMRKEGAEPDFLGQVGNIVKYGALAVVAVMLFPAVRSLLSGSKAS